MKMCIAVLMMLVLAVSVAFGSPPNDLKEYWDANEGMTPWLILQEADLAGLAKLVKFDPAQTNAYGVEAVFQFKDMLTGEPGEYVVTVPHALRNPEKLSWQPNYMSMPWNWKVSESYVCLCRPDYEDGEEMWWIDWAAPGSQWWAVQEEVGKGRAEVEPYVKAKKQELRALKDEFRAIWSRTDITEAEAESLSQEPRKRNIAVRKELDDWENQTGIFVRWNNLDSTWP